MFDVSATSCLTLYVPMFFLSNISLLLAGIGLSSARRSNETQSNELPVAREYFYVGGNYVYIENSGQHIYSNQMYVEKLIPSRPRQPYPLVLIHGNGQTGTNWLNKPDGGAGWATFFLKKGYVVYIVDEPERGRSAWSPVGNVTPGIFTAETLQQRFTATGRYNLWPQASLQTQWPGTGVMGDPIFDQYFASTVQYQPSDIITETNMQAAGTALLEKIGPAVLLSHSRGGPFPWLMADSVPHLVKAIVAIEPNGPPFQEIIFSTAKARPYGITNIPLTFSPMNTNATVPLRTVKIPNNSSVLDYCIVQAEPARQLVKLVNTPVLIENGEASYHAVYDDCTWAFLRQAGVPAERLRLGDVGIHGNGHLQFLERNSDEIAVVLEKWIRSKVE